VCAGACIMRSAVCQTPTMCVLLPTLRSLAGVCASGQSVVLTASAFVQSSTPDICKAVNPQAPSAGSFCSVAFVSDGCKMWSRSRLQHQAPLHMPRSQPRYKLARPL
jgi:hypothetical protein